MPINTDKLEDLLRMSGYDRNETDFLVDGFRNGFDIGYQGPELRQSTSSNIPLTIGLHQDLWDKIMTEVDAGRIAGPFADVPFKNYIQSPIGLVPKSGGKTRMIFHLSFNFEGQEPQGSVNYWMPKELCSVKYNDLDAAVRECLRLCKEFEQRGGESSHERPIIFLGKTDLSSTFRVLPLKIACICWLVFKAKDPKDNKYKFFVDKCLPFGASISCSHYQRFSNGLKHILQTRTGCVGHAITNYLDDFLFLAIAQLICNQMIQTFLDLCSELNLPVAIEKTEWADTVIVFLGILLNGASLTLSIPLDKRTKALNLLKELTGKKKATVKQLQILTGYLNFLTKAIFPERTFTRRMYAKYSEITGLKQYHHVKLDSEFRFDCEVWRIFLAHHRDESVCRPMVDLESTVSATTLQFYKDVSANQKLGFGGIFNKRWLFGKWEVDFIKVNKPSIEYLELYAVIAAIITWGQLLQDQRDHHFL